MTRRRPRCVRSHRAWRNLAIFSLPMILTGVLAAQDPFEIHVLEYEQLQLGQFTFENHTNYVGEAATIAAQNVFHDTYELTAGITDNLSFGIMQLNARAAGTPLESAGWRFVPHVYVPRSWRWPLDIGFVSEWSFNNPAWTPNSRSVELLAILEKRFGRLQIDLNPDFSRSLRGPDTNRGWAFGLAARLGFEATKRLTPSFEYYSDGAPLFASVLVHVQTRQIFPGADLRLMKNVVWNVGVGVGMTPGTDRLVFKSRLEVSFGGKRKR